MENKKQRIIQITTSEVEIVTCHYTYEAVVGEDEANEFIEKMDNLCGHRQVYEQLNKHSYKLVEKTDGKQYPADDNYSTSVESVELTNQLAWSL